MQSKEPKVPKGMRAPIGLEPEQHSRILSAKSESNTQRKARLIARRAEQLARRPSSDQFSDLIEDATARMRGTYARNGSGRPPKNKTQNKGDI